MYVYLELDTLIHRIVNLFSYNQCMKKENRIFYVLTTICLIDFDFGYQYVIFSAMTNIIHNG